MYTHWGRSPASYLVRTKLFACDTWYTHLMLLNATLWGHVAGLIRRLNDLCSPILYCSLQLCGSMYVGACLLLLFRPSTNKKVLYPSSQYVVNGLTRSGVQVPSVSFLLL